MKGEAEEEEASGAFPTRRSNLFVVSSFWSMVVPLFAVTLLLWRSSHALWAPPRRFGREKASVSWGMEGFG